ncbi:hypothetical protein GZH82_04305 [Staphylococcus ursi]|uniref:hypothetical protein n=1 Tax=Staphylococcus sp. MI 10-1553 TaxID=1912064 RepID=UPI001398D51B|nr:hypothetical protein [Staphylococcus sp. MI 10-1553]QHW36639.1 hypothetical protein GZH82_04305 [Staphylococcus sp. MI 10-1553]
MLDLKLVSKDEKSVTYDYYPNNQKVSGRITIGIDNLKVLSVEKTEYDKDISLYIGHAIYEIRANIKNNESPEALFIGW